MTYPPDRARRQQHIEKTRPQRSGHCQRQYQRRKSQQQIYYAHQRGVRPAAVVSRQYAHRQCDGHTEGQGNGGSQEGNARAVNDTAEGIPPQVVRAHEMFCRRRRQTVRQVNPGRVVQG